MAKKSPVDTLFETREPIAREIYDALLAALGRIGPFTVEPKKTCIHLARESAFAGVHPRKAGVLLNLRTSEAIKSKRIRKCEQVSKTRFHNEVLLESIGHVDAELIGWLERAYRL